MSDVEAKMVPTKPAVRLGIVHFLGWMIGVSAVLAIYRAATALSNRPQDADLTQQLIQLGFGLAYGSAVSGLGLFLWRWWRGTGNGPSQPGHWLLVFGGIGLVIDVGLAAILQAIAIVTGESMDQGTLSYQVWSRHQIIGWSMSAAIAIVILIRLRADWWWRCTVLLVLLMTIANVAAVVVYVCGASGTFRGTWAFDVAQYVRVVGALACLAAIAFAELCDRRLGRRRDWLHLVGIVTALALASVELVVQGYFLWLRWQ